MLPQRRKDAKENQVKKILMKSFSLCELSVPSTLLRTCLAGEKSDFRMPHP
jgi:hypothetical protein